MSSPIYEVHTEPVALHTTQERKESAVKCVCKDCNTLNSNQVYSPFGYAVLRVSPLFWKVGSEKGLKNERWTD